MVQDNRGRPGREMAVRAAQSASGCAGCIGWSRAAVLACLAWSSAADFAGSARCAPTPAAAPDAPHPQAKRAQRNRTGCLPKSGGIGPVPLAGLLPDASHPALEALLQEFPTLAHLPFSVAAQQEQKGLLLGAQLVRGSGGMRPAACMPHVLVCTACCGANVWLASASAAVFDMPPADAVAAAAVAVHEV